jgi:hypothetical protein
MQAKDYLKSIHALGHQIRNEWQIATVEEKKLLSYAYNALYFAWLQTEPLEDGEDDGEWMEISKGEPPARMSALDSASNATSVPPPSWGGTGTGTSGSSESVVRADPSVREQQERKKERYLPQNPTLSDVLGFTEEEALLAMQIFLIGAEDPEETPDAPSLNDSSRKPE